MINFYHTHNGNIAGQLANYPQQILLQLAKAPDFTDKAANKGPRPYLR
jgi:hypothetical protein